MDELRTNGGQVTIEIQTKTRLAAICHLIVTKNVFKCHNWNPESSTAKVNIAKNAGKKISGHEGYGHENQKWLHFD